MELKKPNKTIKIRFENEKRMNSSNTSALAIIIVLILVIGIPALIGFGIWRTERRDAKIRKEMTQVEHFTITGPAAEKAAREHEEMIKKGKIKNDWKYSGF